MRAILLCFISLASFYSCAQSDELSAIEPVISYHRFQLGDRTVTIRKEVYAPAGRLLFVQLHDNEHTSEEAAKSILEKRGGIFLSIENERERNIRFQLKGKMYTFDPNRMFSTEGIKASLDLLSEDRPEAVNLIARFSRFLLNQIPDSLHLIALHNNTDEQYSILSYLKDTSMLKDASLIHVQENQDADDFFFTTDADTYQYLKAQGFNSVLQNNEGVTEDGSLSVYFGKRGKPYTNVEAEHGHLAAQTAMLKLLAEYLEKQP